MVDALDAVVAKHPNETVVVVSHADPIKSAIAHYSGMHLDLFQRIVVSPCSVTAIAYSAGGPVVLTVNSTGGSIAMSDRSWNMWLWTMSRRTPAFS